MRRGGIPVGSVQKWEVSAKTGVLSWEIKNGKLRLIDYFAYPGNYGMIAKTMADDGDTLDVNVLGPTMARGSVAKVRIIGGLVSKGFGEAAEARTTLEAAAKAFK